MPRRRRRGYDEPDSDGWTPRLEREWVRWNAWAWMGRCGFCGKYVKRTTGEHGKGVCNPSDEPTAVQRSFAPSTP